MVHMCSKASYPIKQKSWNICRMNFCLGVCPKFGEILRAPKNGILKEIDLLSFIVKLKYPVLGKKALHRVKRHVLLSVPIKCMSQNFCPGDLRSGKFRDLLITSLWGNMYENAFRFA